MANRPPCSRVVGATEHGMCLALPGGTGINLMALLLSKPLDLQLLQNALHKIQNSHPILASKLRLDPNSGTFSFVTPSVTSVQVKSVDLLSTLKIIDDGAPASTESLSPFHKLVEHEMNLNPWEKLSSEGSDLLKATVYELEGERRMVALKVAAAACDVAAAAALLSEVLTELNKRGSGAELEIQGKGEVRLGMEDYVPSGMRKKSLWARGMNMLGYTLSSFRLTNIDFVDPRSPRRTQLLRLRLEQEETDRLLQGCRDREIELFGVLLAAALMAARLCKRTPEGQRDKYAVIIAIDCRASLEHHLTTHDVGYYTSAIVNTHYINGRDQLWSLAKRAYNSFKEAKNGNKHLSFLADLSFLMRKVIDNPGLTTSSSLRSSFVSVLEDTTVDNMTKEDYKEMGVEDYMVCSSIHGIGPTLALYNAVRDRRLDCACVYPAPLHSREQMQELIHHMKRILVDASCLSSHDGKLLTH